MAKEECAWRKHNKHITMKDSVAMHVCQPVHQAQKQSVEAIMREERGERDNEREREKKMEMQCLGRGQHIFACETGMRLDGARSMRSFKVPPTT